ncbi:hypothetical protein KCU92_g58, partial [Aureobasidium melanogenum]
MEGLRLRRAPRIRNTAVSAVLSSAMVGILETRSAPLCARNRQLFGVACTSSSSKIPVMLTEGKVLYAAITSSNRPLLHSAMNSSLTALVLIVREDDMEVLEDEQDDLAELKNLRFRHDCAFVGRVQRKKSSKDAGSTMTARVRPDRPHVIDEGQEAFRSSGD